MEKYRVVCSKCGVVDSGMERVDALSLAAYHIVQHNKKGEFFVDVRIEKEEENNFVST